MPKKHVEDQKENEKITPVKYDSQGASSAEMICPSEVMQQAFQVGDKDKIRLLDLSLQDLVITGNGKPVWCRANDLTRYALWRPVHAPAFLAGVRNSVNFLLKVICRSSERLCLHYVKI